VGNQRVRHIILLVVIAFAASACALDQPTIEQTLPLPTIAATLTRTIAPSPSFTPEPTQTRTPKPTATTIPYVAFSHTPAESAYQIPLTVQRLTPFEANVHFELDRPSSGWLLYRPELNEVTGWWTIPLAADEAMHQIPLVGLTPGTRYSVQVGLGEDLESLLVPRLFGSSWGPIRFEAPAIGEPEFRFGVIGDSGFGDDRTRQLVNLMASYDLDFVLHTGDVVYNVYEESGPEEAFATKYYRVFAPLLVEHPVFPVLGNHEFDIAARSESRPFFIRAFHSMTDPSVPETALGTWYAFGFSGIQFLMLDSQAFHGAGGRAEQTAWLTERLADPNYRFSIPVFHTPPYTSGRHRNDGAAVRSDWIPLFEGASVPITFSGHDHNYERILRNGITYMVSGGGSPVLYPETERVEGSQKFQRRMHFILVEVINSNISLSAIDIDGMVLDRTTIPVSPD